MAEENYVIAHSGRLCNPLHHRGPNNRMSRFIDFWNNREIKCSKGQKKVRRRSKYYGGVSNGFSEWSHDHLHIILKYYGGVSDWL